MELFLIKVAAFARPLASLEYAETVFELVGSALFLVLLGALLMRMATTKAVGLSLIDLLVFAFTLWCLAIYVVYYDSARIKDVAKLLIPLLTYIVAKNIVQTRRDYRSLLIWMLLGFVPPIVLSVALIATGHGLDYVSYWTDLPRWEGAYVGAHSMGHSMTLFLMALTVYWATAGDGDRIGVFGTRNPAFVACAALVAGLSLYCLYMSQVRSAVLGLLTFTATYLYFVRRAMLVYGAIAAALVAAATVPYWLPALLPEVAMMRQGIELDVMDLGSDRPRYWLNDLMVFADLPLDRKLAGVGIGAIAEHSIGPRLYGHNDWLQILTQTGLVGLVLFLALQVAVLRRILRSHAEERPLFLALFCAVNVMMLVSNSYVWRIQVSQLYYMILAFIEIREPHRRGAAAPAWHAGTIAASAARYRPTP
ncbi:MAG TPA: O-antigen ligase family protein [Burkholderiales bacterium]